MAQKQIWEELTRPGSVTRTVKLADPISVAVGQTAEEVLIIVLLILFCDGLGVGLHESAAKASRVRFNDDGKEPARRWLDAAQ